MNEHSPTELSIIVPTLNEAANVYALVKRLEQALEGTEWEVIFVDDDSIDGTAERVRQLALRSRRVRVLRRVGRRGLASAAVEGMMAASGDYLAVMDGDLQHDESALPQMLAKIRQEGLDVVVASRYVEGGSMGDFAPERVTLSGWGKRISQIVCRARVSDPMSGFFLVDRRFVDEVIYDVSGIGFKILVDLLASARRPVRIGEVGYRFRNREAGESKLDALVLVEYLQLVFDKLTGSVAPARFVLFAGVGALGVGVHLAVMAAFYRGWGWDFVAAYAAAALAAMTSNFFLNNAITYRDCRLVGWRQLTGGLASFYAACGLGAWFSSAIAESLRHGGADWALASMAGIAVAGVWNYAITQVLTWRSLKRARDRRRRKRGESHWVAQPSE